MSQTTESPMIAVFGATGLVGREALAILAERQHPASRAIAFASERSSGALLPYGEGTLRARTLHSPEDLAGIDAAIFCLPAGIAHTLAPAAVAAGVTVIDNSSAFRPDPGVPLVIPEINGDLLRAGSPPRLIANPNCSTILLLLALEPLRRAFGIRRIVTSTYQAVSGAGAPALQELRAQTAAIAAGVDPLAEFFPEQCAMNVFNHESAIDIETGLNGEEQKIINETRRIWPGEGCAVTPTCVRVPVERAHSQSVLVELDHPASVTEIRRAIDGFGGVQLQDDRRSQRFPTPLRAAGCDEVHVGRVRIPDPGRPNEAALWLCGDQLRKGAALNAVQILGAIGLVRDAAPPLAGCAYAAAAT